MRGLRHSCPKRCLRWLVAAVAAATSQYGLTQGEDFFDFLPEDLGRLRVTAASAFTESTLDASASVSVVQRGDWERRGARVIPDAVMHLPGVMLLYPPAGGPLIQVRSYDSTSIRGRATLVDGVPISSFAFGSEVFSNPEFQLPVLDSLELVRGPSSILYGSDAFHSALLLSTFRTNVPMFEVSGTAGANDYQRVAIRGGNAVGDDQFLEGALAVAHQGNQHSSFTVLEPGGINWRAEREQSYESGTGMLRWRGKASTVNYQLQVLVDKTRADEFPGSGVFVGDPGRYDTSKRNGELWLVKGTLDGALTDGWAWSWDLYGWRNDFGYNNILPLNQNAYFEDRQQLVEHRYGTSLQLKRADWQHGFGSTQLAVTLGVEGAGVDDHQNGRWLLGGSALPCQPPACRLADYEGLDQTIYSMAVEGKTRWGDGRWQLIYGGRVDEYSTFGAEISPRLGLIWMPTTHYSVRAIYGSAFRAPNANELRGTNFASGSRDLDPETIDSVELALAFARGSWQGELVGFANRWDERILLVQDAAAPLQRRYTNVGSSEAQGLEASLNYRARRWRVELSATAMHNENRNTRREPSLFPEWVVNLGVGYRWPAHDLELFWANRLHENVMAGDTALAIEPVAEAGTFFRSDLSLTQQWGERWQGRLLIRNLFDRDNIWPSITNSRGGIEDIERQLVFEVNYRGLP